VTCKGKQPTPWYHCHQRCATSFTHQPAHLKEWTEWMERHTVYSFWHGLETHTSCSPNHKLHSSRKPNWNSKELMWGQTVLRDFWSDCFHILRFLSWTGCLTSNIPEWYISLSPINWIRCWLHVHDSGECEVSNSTPQQNNGPWVPCLCPWHMQLPKTHWLHHCDISDLRRRVEEYKYLPGDSKSTGAFLFKMIKWFAKQSLRRFCVSFLDF